MATLAELYEFLETKQDDSHLDSRFSYDAFLPVEQPKARLEILTWWKIERLIEDENCNFDKNFIVSYFDERVKATNNQLLKYRYNYFISKRQRRLSACSRKGYRGSDVTDKKSEV